MCFVTTGYSERIWLNVYLVMIASVATKLRFRWSGIRILPDPGERPQPTPYTAGITGSNPPVPVAEWSNARVCSRSLTGVVGSNTAAGMDVCVACCAVETKEEATTIKTKQVGKTYKETTRERLQKKKIPVGTRFFFSFP